VSDDTFDVDWLRLREPTDHRSRSDRLAWTLAREALARSWHRGLDLGAGTGSNVRYLAPRLPMLDRWTLVDHDADLLHEVGPSPGGAKVRRVQGDLAREGLAQVEDHDLVTASALLDLVSSSWVSLLVSACSAADCGALFALTFDGRIEWAQPDPDDALVLDAIHAHQRRDKGLGSALGPDAARTAREAFETAGYRTWMESTPWVLEGRDDQALTRALLDGWVQASVEQRPADRTRIVDWGRRRWAQIEAGTFAVSVGHQDLLALPPTRTDRETNDPGA
jgi:hypothetical protein